MSSEEVYALIENYGRLHLNEFTELEQIKLATFAPRYSDKDRDSISEKEAKDLIRKWYTSVNQLGVI